MSAYFLLRKSGNPFFLCCPQIQIFWLLLPSLLLRTVLSASFSSFCFSTPSRSWSSTSMPPKNSRRKRQPRPHHWNPWIQRRPLQLLPGGHRVSGYGIYLSRNLWYCYFSYNKLLKWENNREERESSWLLVLPKCLQHPESNHFCHPIASQDTQKMLSVVKTHQQLNPHCVF